MYCGGENNNNNSCVGCVEEGGVYHELGISWRRVGYIMSWAVLRPIFIHGHSKGKRQGQGQSQGNSGGQRHDQGLGLGTV